MSEEIMVTKEILLDALADWKIYPSVIEALSAEKKAAFLAQQGYQSAHDLLAHITGWWEETFGIVDDALAGRERPRREYDFDVFNAESLARFKPLTDTEMLARYETERQRLVKLVLGLAEGPVENKRASRWLYGVVIDHAEEHAVNV